MEGSFPKAILNSVPSSSMNLSLHDYHFERFTPTEITDAISSLKNGKSSGVDQLFAEHVKNADKRVTVLLSLLFNACVIHGFLPVGLMETVIVPIIKNARQNISSKDNYRPIALTNTLSQIIEKLILARCSSLLQTTENQFGFKSNSSTDLCVFSLKQVIDYYKGNGSPVYLCFLDVSKAFDRVPHSILFSKLVERKVPHIVIRLLAYWYTSQTFVIRWNNMLPDPFTVSNGVRQGSILSPTLFSIYLDSLSVKLSASGVGCTFNSKNFNHLVYADDTVLLAPSPKALQSLINICVSFANNHGLVYNEQKTKFMCLKPAGLTNIYVPNVELNGKTLELVKREKYLGFFVTDSFYDDEYIKNEIGNTYARGNTIIRHFKHCSADVKVKLYNSYCCSIYCCALISVYHKTVLDKLSVACNKVFKSLMGVPRDFSVSALFVNLNVSNFAILRHKLVYSFLNRIRLSSNSLICTLFNSVHFSKCKLKEEWDTILRK